MIETWAEKIAISIKRANEKETASIEIMKYALMIVINYFVPVIASLTIGLLTGKFSETAISILMFTLIRAVSGGYHFKSATVCMVVTTAITSIPPHIPLPNHWTLGFTVISLGLVALLAPAYIRGYARMPEKYFPLMKLASLLVVSSNLLIQSRFIAIIFLLQGLSLIQIKEVKSS